MNGSRILLLGLAYKAGTSDWRESPSMRVAERLVALGADVRGHDAHIPQAVDLGIDIPRVACDEDELRAADLVILLVDHPDLPYESICRDASLLLDTKGRLRNEQFTGEML